MAMQRTQLAVRCLAGLLVLAPLLGGGWRLSVFPLLAGLAGLAWTGLFLQRSRDGRRLVLPFMALVFGALAAFTALQAFPMGGLLAWISPRAAEVRSFVAPDQRLSITYEVGATWREAAKMMLYGMTVALAYEVARRRGARPVLVAVVAAGVASVLAALFHKAFQIEPMWGFLDGLRPTESLATTFQNPNHASAFLTLSALTSVGLGVDADRPRERALFLGLATFLSGVSVVEPSKGGVIALGLGLVLFGALLFLRNRRGGDRIGIQVLFAALFLPVAGVMLQLDTVLGEFGWGEEAAPLGLLEKLAAVQNAGPIILEHAVAGIGRGAYVSVYPHYQSSALQLTFAFPENIVAQLLAEWGLFVGGAALLGLVYAVATRLGRARKPYEMGAAAAMASVLVHDLVDFSLEMPGVALSVAAIAGATAPRRGGPVLELRGGAKDAGLALLPVLVAALLTYGAFRSGDLETDLKWLSHHGQVVAGGGSPDHDGVRRRAEAHPASVLVASQVAYIFEVQESPDLRRALAFANRALYLGPRYADAHLLAARLLLRAGHRNQAFAEVRRAWELTRGRQDVVAVAARWARSTSELLRAIPRLDAERDVVHPAQLARLVLLLAGRGALERAREVLDVLPPLDEEDLDSEVFEAVARAALVAGRSDVALAAGRRGAELRPEDTGLKLMLARMAGKAGQIDEARRLVGSIPVERADPQELFELRLELAVAANDFPGARDALTELQRRLPVTRENQKKLALREAELHVAEGRPDRAVRVLGRAVEWAPSDVDVRLRRAQALARLGRVAEARVDVEFVLRRDPEHGPARGLLRRLSVSD